MSLMFDQLVELAQEEASVKAVPGPPLLTIVPPVPQFNEALSLPLPVARVKSRKLHLALILSIVLAAFNYFSNPFSQNNIQHAHVPTPEIPAAKVESISNDSDLLRGRVAIDLYQKGDYQAARDAFRVLSTQYPKSIELINNLALAEMKSGDAKGAERLLKQALKLAPANAISLNNLGTLYIENRKWTAAIAFLRKAELNQPDLASAHLNLGKAYELSGDFENAISEYEWYVAFKSADPTLKPLLQARVKKLKDFLLYSPPEDSLGDD